MFITCPPNLVSSLGASMQKNEISTDLSEKAFEFFYCFSRFEFALKENTYLKNEKPGSNAEPSWHKYTEIWQGRYGPSKEAVELLSLAPQKQVVVEGKALGWQALELTSCRSKLEAVVLCLKTVRNNLFHGGKHGSKDWDDPQRTQALLVCCIHVLEQLAKLGDLEADFMRHY